MNFVIESIGIGFYCCILFSVLEFLIHDYRIVFFMIGLLKHWTLRALYCKYGLSCQKSHLDPGLNAFILPEPITIILEFLVEGFVFLLAGYVLLRFCQQFSNRIIKSRLFVVFVVGASLHMIGDIMEIHARFCSERC
jgi:hypothetical protein